MVIREDGKMLWYGRSIVLKFTPVKKETKMKKLFFSAIIILLMFSVANAKTIKVSWDANTESDLAGYKVYYGTASGVYGDPIDTGLATSTTIQLSPSVGTTYYFAVSAYDTSANESELSDEASLFVGDSVAPTKPKGLIASIIDAVAKFFKNLFWRFS